jgi:hypothetical protein
MPLSGRQPGEWGERDIAGDPEKKNYRQDNPRGVTQVKEVRQFPPEAAVQPWMEVMVTDQEGCRKQQEIKSDHPGKIEMEEAVNSPL